MRLSACNLFLWSEGYTDSQYSRQTHVTRCMRCEFIRANWQMAPSSRLGCLQWFKVGTLHIRWNYFYQTHRNAFSTEHAGCQPRRNGCCYIYSRLMAEMHGLLSFIHFIRHGSALKKLFDKFDKHMQNIVKNVGMWLPDPTMATAALFWT